MATSNATVASALRRFAAALVLQGADRFKVKAYRRAADAIEMLHADVAKMVARGEDLQTIPGIGKSISGAVREIVRYGSMKQLDAMLAQTKPELIELTMWPRLDPQKVARIYKKLNITGIEELRRRLDSGEIRETMGARMDFHVRQGLDERPRMLLPTANDAADKIEAFLKSIRGVTRVARVGSLRRKVETVGDLNFLVATSNSPSVYRQFAKFGGVTETSERGDARRFALSSGVGVTLVCVDLEQWGLALILHTGSAKHVADLQAFATRKRRALTVEALESASVDMSEEDRVYRGLRLAFIEPELREGRGEIKAAAKGQLPELISREDIRGDLHMHTTASDGANTIAEMAAAAVRIGYEYIAITDHSQSLKITNGLSEKRLLKHIKDIDAFNARQNGIVVLKSAEVDILQDGSLDYSNSVLKELDFTICSIHSRFGQNRQEQTDRIRRAMDNPYFNILGHATGRLLLKREGYDVDLEVLFEHAKENGRFFEINSSPDRLDLSDEHAKMAKELGIRIAINTDAHSIVELDFISSGIQQARRGWLRPKDVLNTLSIAKLKKLFKR